MRDTTTKSYHDYVIKDGKFIGEFDKMYQEVNDPWMQSMQPNRIARYAAINFIKTFKIRSVLECGSGLGYFSNWIHRETGIVPKGIDISQTAVEKARQRFPELDFQVGNVVTDLHKFPAVDAILLSEILWYILPDLNAVLRELKQRYTGKHLIINQVFYKNTQRYGTEYFTSMKELTDFIPFPQVGFCESSNINETTVETATVYHVQ